MAPSLPPRVACSSQAATGRRGLGARWLFRRRARNAADQVDERRTGYGRDLAGQLEAAPGIVVSAHHRAPEGESAKPHHTTTDASSVSWVPSMGPTRGVPAPWRASVRLSCGQLGRVRSHVHHHAHQRRVMEPADRTGQSESSELASQGLSIIVAKAGRPRHTSREPAPHRPSAGRSGNNTTDLGVSSAGIPGTGARVCSYGFVRGCLG